MIKKNMCCRQVAIAKMVQFLGARRASLRDTLCSEKFCDVWLARSSGTVPLTLAARVRL